ncbi:uncharacterized protein LOC115881546 [Sitophilus oryzae]|uniref:Uncharacterized protein LOC115881546 n=1 Tax=Sitophilus oryzae TaxID=7048 RepID=A0A6J2XVZ9_SITOR|nr:uncharacterized protein LOC115881546 [Sitophilus oryzae]
MSPRLITRSPVTLALNKKIKTWVNKSVALKSASDKRTDNMSGKYSILETSQNRISIEVSPNNNFNAKLLGELGPHFISVTWLGAKYLQLPNHQIPTVVLAQNLNKLKCPVLVHLPGRNLKKERMLEILNLLKNSGIKHVLALQGDWVHVLEKDDTKVDFPYASDLVSFIKENFGSEFCVGVTAYPDLHPHCEDLERDLDYLKKKISLGAEFILTQAVFDFDVLENYVKSCRRHGINVPIFVGVFIIKSYQSLKNMAKWCEFKFWISYPPPGAGSSSSSKDKEKEKLEDEKKPLSKEQRQQEYDAAIKEHHRSQREQWEIRQLDNDLLQQRQSEREREREQKELAEQRLLLVDEQDELNQQPP